MPDDPNQPRAVAFPPTLIPHVLDYFARINQPVSSVTPSGLRGPQPQFPFQMDPLYRSLGQSSAAGSLLGPSFAANSPATPLGTLGSSLSHDMASNYTLPSGGNFGPFADNNFRTGNASDPMFNFGQSGIGSPVSGFQQFGNRYTQPVNGASSSLSSTAQLSGQSPPNSTQSPAQPQSDKSSISPTSSLIGQVGSTLLGGKAGSALARWTAKGMITQGVEESMKNAGATAEEIAEARAALEGAVDGAEATSELGPWSLAGFGAGGLAGWAGYKLWEASQQPKKNSDSDSGTGVRK